MQEHEAQGSSQTKITTADAGQFKALVDLIRNDGFAMSFQSMRQYRQALIRVVENTAAPPAEQKPFEWPLLDAPALIGGVVVGKGCSSGHVVMIAQRKYQYEAEHSPEEHARRKKAFQDALAQIRDGAGQQPDEAWSDDADSDSAAVAEAIRAREEAIAQVSGLQLQVAGLVEALEEIEQWVGRWCADNHPVVRFARKALDAHRKRGGE